MELKMADVIPIPKTNEKNIMKNYRPVSLLPIISKLFEKIMFKQISTFVDNFLIYLTSGKDMVLNSA